MLELSVELTHPRPDADICVILLSLFMRVNCNQAQNCVLLVARCAYTGAFQRGCPPPLEREKQPVLRLDVVMDEDRQGRT